MRPPRNVPVVSTTARAANAMPGGSEHSTHAATAQLQIRNFLLEHIEPRLRFDCSANGLAIQLAIRLRARGADGRPLAGIQRAELDAGGIGGARHDAAQGIDLANQVALADATDGGIAAHRTDSLDALREQQRARATGAPQPAPLPRRHARRPPRSRRIHLPGSWRNCRVIAAAAVSNGMVAARAAPQFPAPRIAACLGRAGGGRSTVLPGINATHILALPARTPFRPCFGGKPNAAT